VRPRLIGADFAENSFCRSSFASISFPSDSLRVVRLLLRSRPTKYIRGLLISLRDPSSKKKKKEKTRPPLCHGWGWPPVFYDVSIPLFFWTEAFGIWSDTSHYIYMVFLCILNELRHFGICNDDLLFSANNPILFLALRWYLEKLLQFNINIS
jgi:hypothetical protein